MEHVCAGLQGSRAAQYDEAQLEILEAGAEVDTKYLAFGFEELVHGEAYLDKPSLRGLHDGEVFIVPCCQLILRLFLRF